MRQSVRDAAARLHAVVTAENAVLATLDLGRVGGFMEEKRAAIAALRLATTTMDDAGGPVDPQLRQLGEALEQVTAENKDLLERAIMVQNRVMATLADAASEASVPAGYGARGRRPRSTSSKAVALIVRA